MTGLWMRKVLQNCMLRKGASVVALCTFSLVVQSNPVVTDVTVEGGEPKHGEMIKLRGAGFGVKQQAAPLFVDYVEEVYVNGVIRDAYSSFQDGQAIRPASSDSNSLWAAATSVTPVRYVRTGSQRHRFDVARYHFSGEDSWLGRPVAYGGVDGWSTPKDNPQLYVSWWVKVDYNSAFYWRISPRYIEGDFVPGEKVSSQSNMSGIFIGVDKEGLLNFEFDGQRNANNLRNVTFVGSKSNAKVVFPEEFRGGSGYGFETPGTKQLRVWDDPNSLGIRASLSQTDFYVGSSQNRDYSSNMVYQFRDMNSSRWHHFEVELDVEAGTLKSWFNGELGGIAKFDPRAAALGKYSPTIALIGNNAKQDQLQNMYISEIYMDKSIQRVIIGDSDSYSGLSHYEVQRPVSWSDGAIDFAFNLGSLDFSEGLYVYVFDSNGVPNQKGFPLCIGVECPSPPRSVQLKVLP